MKYELAEVEIVTFLNIEDNEHQFSGRPTITLERNEDHITRTCLIDWNKKIAYNIYTLEEQFPILEKEDNGLLKPNQNIICGQKYAIKEKTIKKNIETRLEYIYRKRQLKKVLERQKKH